MKNSYLSLIFLVFLLSACQKDSDVNETSSALTSTIDFAWSVLVVEEESLQHWGGDLYGNTLQNVSVKLMVMDEVLWESNTDKSGSVTFPEQAVPDEGAFFLFEAPGYYPLIVQVQGESIPLWQVNMIRNTLPNINGEAIKNAESYITLTGQFQAPLTARDAWFYVTNSDNALIGNAKVGGEASRFYMTTLPNEELFLHYHVECGEDAVIPLGSFSESQDIGVLLDQSFDFSYDYDFVSIYNISECSTGEKLIHFDVFLKTETLTHQRGIRVPDCEGAAFPILIGVATQNPRKYTEFTIMHTPGQQSDVPDQELCEDDDTFLNYKIGDNQSRGGDVFTFANVLPDGQVVMKQAEHSLNNNDRFAMVLDASSIGNQQTKVNIEVRNYTQPNGYHYANGSAGYSLNSTITMNDGEFIEGTFIGEVMDAEEVSQGILEGTFRARIQ